MIELDKRTPIIDTIGQTEMMRTLGRAAAELSVAAQKICQFVDGKDPPEGNPERTSTEFHTAYNRVLLCAEYLGLKPDSMIQMVEIDHWHRRLIQTGAEDETPMPQKESSEAHKFRAPWFRKEDEDE